MKYIRLKDNRIIVQGEPSDKGFQQGRFEIHNFGNAETLTPFDNDDILVESSSIEELFDKYIVDANYKDKPYLYDRNEPVNSPEFDSKDEVVYGAIWVRGEHDEPILKPVAKLNEKGELELL